MLWSVHAASEAADDAQYSGKAGLVGGWYGVFRLNRMAVEGECVLSGAEAVGGIAPYGNGTEGVEWLRADDAALAEGVVHDDVAGHCCLVIGGGGWCGAETVFV